MAILAAATALATLAPGAVAAEPNNSPATASGPLTAGKTFRATLGTADDIDWHYFYVPYAARMSVRLTNAAEPGGKASNRRRALSAAVFHVSKGKPLRLVANSEARVRPGKNERVQIDLVPGKYLLPVLHADNGADPLPDVPFRLLVGPPGTTTNSHEIFARRCASAIQRVKRVHRSKVRLAKRVKKARRQDKEAKESRLEDRLDAKRSLAKVVQRNKRIACSVPR